MLFKLAMRDSTSILLLVCCFLFDPLRGYEEHGFVNTSTASVKHPETALEGGGKQIHDILNSVEPDKDNSIIYFDLYDTVHKYFVPKVNKISSSYDIESNLYDLLKMGKMNKIRRRVQTVFECENEHEILHRLPSTLQKRAKATFFKRYSRSTSNEDFKTTIHVKGTIDIMFVNQHKVQFAVKTNFINTDGTTYSVKKLAGDCLLEMPLWCDSAVEHNGAADQGYPPETIYIGVVWDGATGRLCMSFYSPSSDHEPCYVST